MSRKTFDLGGKTFEVKFGWTQISKCRQELKGPTLKGLDLSKALEAKKAISDETNQLGLDRSDQEALIDYNFDTLDSMYTICKIGMMAAGMDEGQCEDTLDEDPTLIKQIYDFFKDRNGVYQRNIDFEPEEEDKKLGEKKS